MYYWARTKEEAKEALIEALKDALPEDKAKRVFDALENFVDKYVEAATEDLDDKINKRGMYDPDY